MKKILKLILILVVAIIIIVITIITLMKKTEVYNSEKIIDIEEINELAEKNSELHIETNRNIFYVVKECVEEFYEYYEYLYPENIDDSQKDEEIELESLKKWYEEKIYAILDKEYINYKNITLDNISDKLGKIGKVKVLVDKVHTKDLEDSSYICFVEGRTIEEKSNIKSFKMAVRLSATNTFKIFLEDYLTEKNYTDFSKDIDAVELCRFEITDEKYNTYKSKAISSKDYLNDLFAHYKSSVINDQRYVYDQLIDKDYRNIRFESIDEYIEYVQSNNLKMVLMSLDSYSESSINGVNKYLCKDNYGNYYIFKETEPFQYTVILDNYTIPTEEFTEEYNKSTDQQKVILNIKRFFMGIDDKNYGYSYSVLSEAFKNNKYPTKNDFINYVKQNFFEENNINYISFEKENNLYIYNIKVEDGTGKNVNGKEINVIVKLNGGTDFEMSFGEN